MLGGRAIAYAMAHTMVQRWAEETDNPGAKDALAFLVADIKAVAVEFDLLS